MANTPFPFWIRKEDTSFVNLKVAPYPYDESLMRGVFEDDGGSLSHLRSHFVLGKIIAWDEVHDPRRLYVKSENWPLNPRGLVLTSYSEIQVRYHQKKHTVDSKWGVQRDEFIGQGNDFVQDVFQTVYEKAVAGRALPRGAELRFLLYDPQQLLQEEENLQSVWWQSNMASHSQQRVKV